MNSGIYTITNLINRKIYVGYAANFKRRKRHHMNCLKANAHSNRHLQASYNKQKKEDFIFEILEECEEYYFAALEHYWATILNTHDRKYGYNLKPTNPDRINCRMTKETKQLLSEKVIESYKGGKRKPNTCRAGYKMTKEEIDIRTKTYHTNKNIGKHKEKDWLPGLCELNKKEIYFLNIKGEIVYRFKSLNEAAMFFGITPNVIVQTMKPYRGSENSYYYKGFKAVYKTDYDTGNFIFKTFNKKKPITIMDENMNELETTNSTIQMAKKYGLTTSWVTKCANNGKKYKGFYFKFVFEENKSNYLNKGIVPLKEY